MSDTPQVKPTPTQDELDRHARGERISEHEHDGSPIQHSGNVGDRHPSAAAAAAAMGAPDGMNYNPPSERQKITEEEDQKAADAKKAAEDKAAAEAKAAETETKSA